MSDLEWFQCGYLPRGGGDGEDDPKRTTHLTPCFPRDENDDDVDHRPSLTTMYPGGWGFAVGSGNDGTLWSWGTCRDYLVESEFPDDGRPKEIQGRAPAGVGFASVLVADEKNKSDLVRLGWSGDSSDSSTTAVLALGLALGSTDTLSNNKIKLKQLAAGDKHFLALTDNGEVYSWGENNKGQRGTERNVDRNAATPVTTTSDTNNIKFTYTCAGSEHSVLLDSNGEVWTFGWGLHGQLGHDGCEDVSALKRVDALRGVGKFVQCSAGSAHTVLLTSLGSVYAFGSNRDGQLGVPPEACVVGAAAGTPALVEFPWDSEVGDEGEDSNSSNSSNTSVTFVSKISCGARHTCVVTKTSELCAWGWNGYGQLGLGDFEDRNVPTKVNLNSGEENTHNGERNEKKIVKSVACGKWHTVVGVTRISDTSD